MLLPNFVFSSRNARYKIVHKMLIRNITSFSNISYDSCEAIVVIIIKTILMVIMCVCVSVRKQNEQSHDRTTILSLVKHMKLIKDKRNLRINMINRYVFFFCIEDLILFYVSLFGTSQNKKKTFFFSEIKTEFNSNIIILMSDMYST